MLSIGDPVGGRRVHGVVEGRVVTLVAVSELASGAVEVVYRDDDGRTSARTVGREHPALVDLVRGSRDAPAFDGDPREFLLASAALGLSRPVRGGPTSAVPPPGVDPVPHPAGPGGGSSETGDGSDAEALTAFFLHAFERLGGRVRREEGGGYRVVHAPRRIEDAVRAHGPRAGRERLAPRSAAVVRGAETRLLEAGDPLLDAVVEATLADLGDVLRRGAVLIDRTEAQPDGPVVLHAVGWATMGEARGPTVSRHLDHIIVDAAGAVSAASTCRRCSPPDPCERDAITAAVAVAVEPWVARRRESAVRSWIVREARRAAPSGVSSVAILSSALVIPGGLFGGGRA